MQHNARDGTVPAAELYVRRVPWREIVPYALSDTKIPENSHRDLKGH